MCKENLGIAIYGVTATYMIAIYCNDFMNMLSTEDK